MEAARRAVCFCLPQRGKVPAGRKRALCPSLRAPAAVFTLTLKRWKLPAGQYAFAFPNGGRCPQGGMLLPSPTGEGARRAEEGILSVTASPRCRFHPDLEKAVGGAAVCLFAIQGILRCAQDDKRASPRCPFHPDLEKMVGGAAVCLFATQGILRCAQDDKRASPRCRFHPDLGKQKIVPAIFTCGRLIGPHDANRRTALGKIGF